MPPNQRNSSLLHALSSTLKPSHVRARRSNRSCAMLLASLLAASSLLMRHQLLSRHLTAPSSWLLADCSLTAPSGPLRIEYDGGACTSHAVSVTCGQLQPRAQSCQANLSCNQKAGSQTGHTPQQTWPDRLGLARNAECWIHSQASLPHAFAAAIWRAASSRRRSLLVSNRACFCCNCWGVLPHWDPIAVQKPWTLAQRHESGFVGVRITMAPTSLRPLSWTRQAGSSGFRPQCLLGERYTGCKHAARTKLTAPAISH